MSEIVKTIFPRGTGGEFAPFFCVDFHDAESGNRTLKQLLRECELGREFDRGAG